MENLPDSSPSPLGPAALDRATLLPGMRRGAGSAALGQIAGQLVSLAVLGVLYRAISPADFGLLGMALTWVMLVRLLGALGLGVAVIQRRDLDEAQLSALFWVNLAIAAAVSLAGAALAPLVARFYGVPEVAPVAAVLVGTTAVGALGALHQALLERRLRLVRLAVLRLAAQVLGGAAAIAAALAGWGVWSLVAQQYAEWGGLAALCWLAEPWRPARFRRSAVSGEMVRFGGYYTASGFMNYLAINADKIVLGQLGASGERQLGFYSQAFALMMRPVYLVTTPLAGVLLAVLARAAHDPAEYRRLLVEFLRLVGWLLFPAAIGMFVVGRDLVLVLGGGTWQPAGQLLTVLAPAMLVQGFFNLLASVLASAGRARELFFASLAIALVLCQAFIVGRMLGEEFGAADGGARAGRGLELFAHAGCRAVCADDVLLSADAGLVPGRTGSGTAGTAVGGRRDGQRGGGGRSGSPYRSQSSASRPPGGRSLAGRGDLSAAGPPRNRPLAPPAARLGPGG